MNKIEIFPWNKNFETGIAVIDEQHKKIIELINLLAKSMVLESNSEVLDSIFEQLADYAAFHFKTEEAIWHQFLSEDASEKEHQETHDSFIADLQKLKQKREGTSSKQSTEDLLRFLIRWLLFHILENDIYMAKMVQALQSGMDIKSAREKADNEMRQHVGVLVETILSMYEKLSTLILELGTEIEVRKKLETKLQLALNVVENTLDAICVTDSKKIIIDANPAFYETTKLTQDEVIGKPISKIKVGLNEEPVLSQVSKALLTQNQWSGVVANRNKHGEMIAEWLSLSSLKSDDTEIHYVAVFSEITHLANRLSNMEHMAYHDPLTGLPNRVLLTDRLELALANAKRKTENLAICYLDLDDFKSINDSLGHKVGDSILKIIAQRLVNVLRNNDTISRVGGDEFILLLGDLKQPSDYKRLIELILKVVNQPASLENKSVEVNASIGVTIYPEDNSTADDLIQHADRAMYQAKLSEESYRCYSS